MNDSDGDKIPDDIAGQALIRANTRFAPTGNIPSVEVLCRCVFRHNETTKRNPVKDYLNFSRAIARYPISVR